MPTIGCKKRLISFLSLFFFSIPAFSAYGHIYAGASLGASFAKLDNRSPQISYLSGALITDAYPLNSTNASTGIFGINGGYEFTGINWRPAVALGLGIYSLLVDYDYKGQLIETPAGDPSSTLYNYTYSINNTRVMAEIQLTWMFCHFSPFINFGAGPAWYRMNGYTETPATSNGFTALPPFRSHTNVNLAYQAGFGVSTAFNFAGSQSDFPQERISVGYRYVDLGTTTFKTRGSVYPYRLKTGLLTTNDVYLSYTHLF